MVNFFRQFIANSTGKMKTFLVLLKVKNKDEFIWGDVQQQAFDQIK